MAYFYCGSVGDDYRAQYCERCIHEPNPNDYRDSPCPVWDLHFDWNYEAAGDDADPVKREALERLWPSLEDGNPGQCAMFKERPEPRKEQS